MAVYIISGNRQPKFRVYFISIGGGEVFKTSHLQAMVETAQSVGIQLQRAMNARLQKGGLLR